MRTVIVGGCALGGSVALLWGVSMHPLAIAAGGLAAAMSSTQVILGCVLLGLLTPLVKGSWQRLLAPGIAAGARAVVWLLVLWLPMLLGAKLLYPWFDQPAPGFRGQWLSPGWFVARALGYALCAWWLASWIHRSKSGRHGVGVILYVLVFSLAGIDWLMSLQAGFVSGLFALLLIGRQLLSALAFAGLYLFWRNNGLVPTAQRRVLRRLLVAALSLWLYLHVVHYLVIWSVDLAQETAWYRLRSAGYWGALTGLLALGHPVCLLCLASPWGTDPRLMLRVCIAVVLLGSTEAIWMTLPALFAPADMTALLIALAFQLGYGGFLVWAWQWRYRRRRHG